MTTAHHCVAEDIVRMASRERLPEPSNPLGMDGIEFIEYATSQPQAFGDLLQRMGFVPLARHRSREVLLYRDRKSTRLNSSHSQISYAVFCLKKKKKTKSQSCLHMLQQLLVV